MSGKKCVEYDGKDVYNEINTNIGLSFSWESRKGDLFQIESFDHVVVFSIDDTPFEDFLFPRPVRSLDDERALDGSSDEEGDGDESVFLPYTTDPTADGYGYDQEYEEEEGQGQGLGANSERQYIFDIKIVNPIIQKNDNYVKYTVISYVEQLAMLVQRITRALQCTIMLTHLVNMYVDFCMCVYVNVNVYAWCMLVFSR